MFIYLYSVSILNCLLLNFYLHCSGWYFARRLSFPNLYRFGIWRKTQTGDEETQTHTVRLCTGLYYVATNNEYSAVVTVS